MDKIINFKVIGNPTAKERPRYSTKTHSMYTPTKTHNYEKAVREAYKEQTNSYSFEDRLVEMNIVAYYSIPKSYTKKKLKAIADGELFPSKKPDCDNVLKSIADALNGTAYKDDSQIIKTSIIKMFGDEPRVEVEIKPFVFEKPKEPTGELDSDE